MKTYKNPFALKNQWSENECGDPFVMRFNGRYYLYCSSAGNHIKCWISDDLADFEYYGSVCDEPVIDGAYAPEVCYFKGRFYMVTSPKGSGHYLLEGDSPTGPFRLVSDNYGLLIDGSFYIDDDGKQYLLRAGHNGIVIHSMPAPDQVDVNGHVIKESYLNYWTEGPMIIKRDGYYYLTYTGNHLMSKGYRIAYSVSKTEPGSGYVNLKNQTLLLETGPEFHALGHSSNFLAPDLDSCLIAYHNINLDVQPRKRSINIDRLYFNGARMYCNPIWWEQEAHKLPDFYTRGTAELTAMNIADSPYRVIPIITPKAYTAEINVNPRGDGFNLIYGAANHHYGLIVFHKEAAYEIQEKGRILSTGTLNAAISLENYVSVRLAVTSGGDLKIYVNNMLLCSCRTELAEGYIGISEPYSGEIGFIGFSATVEGRGDKEAKKAIPGRFDAIHCMQKVQQRVFAEEGLEIHSAVFDKETKYTYPVNVKETGIYKVTARVLSGGESVRLKVIIGGKETVLEGILSGNTDEEGYEMITLGNVEIMEETSKIVLLTDMDTLVIDYFEFIEHCHLSPLTVVEDGNLVTDELKVLGHKGSKSMIHKYSGFTCAENLGMAFIGGDGLSDYSVLTRINRNHKPTGDVSVYLRVRKESWFQAQVKESLFGYRVKVNADGIYLYRDFYGEELLASYTSRSRNVSTLELDIRVKQSVISLYLNNCAVITYTDPNPYLFGKIGMEASGEGFGFEYFSVYYNSSL